MIVAVASPLHCIVKRKLVTSSTDFQNWKHLLTNVLFERLLQTLRVIGHDNSSLSHSGIQLS